MRVKKDMERTIKVQISDADSGDELLDFLSRRFTYRSRDEWLCQLDEGRFLLNNETEKLPGKTLEKGDLLVYLVPHFEEPPVDTNFSILYEDDDLLVVDKPGNLPCHPGGRYFNHTLWALLKKECKLENASLINRLDRETSGIVLVAKNKKAARYCNEQFAERKVEKRYMVLVEGDFCHSELSCEGFLAVDRQSVIRKKMRFFSTPWNEIDRENVLRCSTLFRGFRSNGEISLVEALPVTGRYHQIRATLRSIGYPVVGDKIYGVNDNFFLLFTEDRLSKADFALLRLDRQALHASYLRLSHPSRIDDKIEFFAPLPVVFQELLEGSEDVV